MTTKVPHKTGGPVARGMLLALAVPLIGGLAVLAPVLGWLAAAGFGWLWQAMAVLAVAAPCLFLGSMMARRLVVAPAEALVALAEDLRRAAPGAADGLGALAARSDANGRLAAAFLASHAAASEAAECRRDAEQAQQAAFSEARDAAAAQETANAAALAALARVAKAARLLACGDLTHRLDTASLPEHAALRDDLNTGFDMIETAIARIGGTARSVREAATDLANASDDLSQRTESQAASLEQTAAALEQITATTRSTADSAARARETVARTKAEAEGGGAVVRQAIAAMSNIETSSAKIGQIIGLIDEISFQTNLLALNAGVEAARAGEAGRGFAVVASEVRALAQRSAESAQEIKALILSSKTEVEKGVELVGGTGEALGRIIAGVGEINDMVGEIATSAAEQSTGLQEVNGAVSQMDQITQQNAAMVEKATIAVRGLSHQTEEFARLVSGFEVRGGASVPVGRPSSGPKPIAIAPKPTLVKPAQAARPVLHAMPRVTAQPRSAAVQTKPSMRAAQPAPLRKAAAPASAATITRRDIAVSPAAQAPQPRRTRATATPPPVASKRKAARAPVDTGGWEEF